MTKVYLLLRNNKQSGPHSLDELLKLGLKPLDLIWVEGKSFGWSYPFEIAALKPYVAAPVSETSNQQIPGKNQDSLPPSQANDQAYLPVEQKSNNEPPVKPKVYVSMPVSANRLIEKPAAITTDLTESSAADMASKIEEKAEELRKKIQSYVPDQKPAAPTKTAEPLVTKYSSSLPEREEAYTSWLYDKKVNNGGAISEIQKRWGSIVIAALLILVVGYGVSQYHGDNTDIETAKSAADISKATTPAPEPLISDPVPDAAVSRPVTENNIADNSADNGNRVTESDKNVVKNEVAVTKKKLPETHKAGTKPDNNKKSIAVVKASPKEQPVTSIVESKVPEVKTAPVKSETVSAPATQKKKKTLNEKVDAFFSKFSHKLETLPVVENTQSKTTNTNSSPGTAERKSVHRDDKPVSAPVASNTTPASTVSSTNLAEYVEVTSTKPSENWMLGVHGMKVSLHNTSKEVVKTAEVELRYYTEQNEVLEKKIVSFNNIQPGKTVTLPAPDHRLADHADFRLVTAK